MGEKLRFRVKLLYGIEKEMTAPWMKKVKRLIFTWVVGKKRSENDAFTSLTHFHHEFVTTPRHWSWSSHKCGNYDCFVIHWLERMEETPSSMWVCVSMARLMILKQNQSWSSGNNALVVAKFFLLLKSSCWGKGTPLSPGWRDGWLDGCKGQARRARFMSILVSLQTSTRSGKELTGG